MGPTSPSVRVPTSNSSQLSPTPLPPPQLEVLKEEALLLQTRNDWAVLEHLGEEDSPPGFPRQSGARGGGAQVRVGMGMIPGPGNLGG